MKAWKVVACLGAGALCVVTGGLAAPAIGAVVGSSVLGLSGAAATSAGLAAIGGGSLAAGGLGMAGGTAIISAVAGGVGAVTTVVATNVAEGAKAKKQNEELRSELRNSNIDNATKQKVIMQLNEKVEKLRRALADEKARADKSDDRIGLIEEQLADMLEKLKTAQTA
ncbi:hypothetical protein [Paenibacillus stellifer]|uniref:hypothetical protein n=1 Tax=Paenibacillus stellifer TaxID=169760 RepID=UPI0012EED6CC|nr:hypothetical protein [Paenibacillus stellifer]